MGVKSTLIIMGHKYLDGWEKIMVICEARKAQVTALKQEPTLTHFIRIVRDGTTDLR